MQQLHNMHSKYCQPPDGKKNYFWNAVMADAECATELNWTELGLFGVRMDGRHGV